MPRSIEEIQASENWSPTKRGQQNKTSIPVEVGKLLRETPKLSYTLNEILDLLIDLDIEIENEDKLLNHVKHYNTAQFKGEHPDMTGYIVGEWDGETRWYYWCENKPNYEEIYASRNSE